jgi:hypothetical protein
VSKAGIADESAKAEDMFLSQVIFTDDLGSFYRVVSITGRHKRTINVYTPFNVFHDVRDKQEQQTVRGLEVRVINVEAAGAEVAVTTGSKDGNPTTVKPDLLTANAIFAANNRVYHLTAGLPLYQRSTVAQVTGQVRRRLEEFLTGFEVLEKK